MPSLRNTLLITNNPLVNEKYANKQETEFIDTDFQSVLKVVRDRIHKGHKLLTHPLSGSVKPNENPYKSVLLSKSSAATDADSVMLVEQCIITAEKFEKKTIHDKHLHDLQVVDLSLISEVLEKNRAT